jgi:HNH endonuclease
MKDFSYPAVTAGENLYLFVRSWIRQGNSMDESFYWLDPIQRSDEWTEYIEQFMAVALTGQIVAAGRTLRELYDGSTPFKTEFRSCVTGLLRIDRANVDKLMRMATAAVDESLRDIANGLRRKLRQWAIGNHPLCYLCGEPLDFKNGGSKKAYTADHIWPLSFGGDSVAENLLPACRECNHEHKGNFASWAMTSVQSVILGLNPSAESLGKATGVCRFGLHHRRVQQLAIDEKVSLRDAYERVGPSEALRTLVQSEVGTFFNLANYNEAI